MRHFGRFYASVACVVKSKRLSNFMLRCHGNVWHGGDYDVPHSQCGGLKKPQSYSPTALRIYAAPVCAKMRSGARSHHLRTHRVSKQWAAGRPVNMHGGSSFLFIICLLTCCLWTCTSLWTHTRFRSVRLSFRLAAEFIKRLRWWKGAKLARSPGRCVHTAADRSRSR